MGNACTAKREVKLVLIGLDLAGKTTVLNRLCFKDAESTTPTVGFNFENISYKNLKISIWDTGGQDKIRDLWKHYYGDVEGVLFVVDSTDEQRLHEAKDALHRAILNENLRGSFLAVLANKRDLSEYCLDINDVRTQLELISLPKDCRWELFEVSALKGTGLNDVLEWIRRIT